MRTTAVAAGVIAALAIAFATLANRGFGDAETARSLLNFGVASAVICGVAIFLDRKRVNRSDY